MPQTHSNMAAPAPPTPQSSKIAPKPARTELELSFALPPPALEQAGTASKKQSAPRIYRPPSPPSPQTSLPPPPPPASSKGRKRRASASTAVELPPPPTRTRKIIQMKPSPSSSSATTTDSTANSNSNSTSSTTTTAAPSSKRTKTSGTTNNASSRKVARKTAHSLIERRRRSKMNEEFAVLKGLVPACQGVEMHKLAILQASIEYVRYLEGCLGELKKQVAASPEKKEAITPPSPAAISAPTAKSESYRPGSRIVYHMEDDEDEDEDEEDGEEEDEEEENDTYEEPPSRMSFSSLPSSAAPSPAFLPQAHPSPFTFHHSQSHHQQQQHIQRLPSISPLLYPHAGMEDTDATTAGALLMLADVERRRSSSSGSIGNGGNGSGGEARGMSVRELLSS